MHGKYQYQVLSNAYGRDHIIEQSKANNIPWEEHSHKGVNWMRASGALVNHIDQGRDFHMENTDPIVLRRMHKHYEGLREMHKQTMIPHVRAAMHKLHENSNEPHRNPMDFLPEAYKHLEANGGHYWAEKIHTLNHLNNHIKKLSTKLTDLGHQT